MSSPVEISDDDDSFEVPVPAKMETGTSAHATVDLSSDNDSDKTIDYSDTNLTSDEETELPEVKIISKKTAVIKNLFPTSTKPGKMTSSTSKMPVVEFDKPKLLGFEKMIGGIKVHLPVEPYGSQMALMFKVITAINKGQNCLLESPTGSGKTLALLCAALAWQQHQRNRMATTLAQGFQDTHPQLWGKENVVEQIASPKKVDMSKVFSRPSYGEKSIYDKPGDQDACGSGIKRMEPETCDDSPNNGLVTIHNKKRKLTPLESKTPESPSTPEKTTSPPRAETPESISIPTIYYGARTHKQLQQVIKEFKRTFYCGEATMTILASREYGCIREFDRQTWKTKNDMCRGCTKTHTTPKGEKTTNCQYFDNHKALNHGSLPPAFDLEELVAAGEAKIACPYYAARNMSATAHIVFCPYNYLIEPGIRSSMSIDIRDKIIIIDEAHNIEDICRDAASQTITRDSIQLAIKELSVVAEYRYSNQDVMSYIDHLLRSLRFWDDWFVNQIPLVNNKPMNYNEAVHTWEVQHFAQTLNNHNLGQEHLDEFIESAEIFCKRLREDARTLFGVSQATGTLIESLQTVLGFLFRSDGKYLDDFVPALVKTGGGEDSPRYSQYSQFNQSQDKEALSLRLLCMNPAVVFEGLKVAKCVLLASGTLTPLISLHSELGTPFPLQVSPNHVIPGDRVWIGTLSTCPNGQRLECNSRGTDQPSVQDALGQTVLWVSQVTPHGVLCFLPSYLLINKLIKRWRETGLWAELSRTKRVFTEARSAREHSEIMEDYYAYSASDDGALLFAVYRGKVSEGMDFKDHQARAVITVGVPYPNTFDMAVKAKMKYNDKYAAQRNLLSSREWLRVQAYRALNQAVGRCVRHRGDWGAVLLIDARFQNSYYTDHLSKWVKGFLGNNHHTYESLVNSPNSLESFMQNMTIRQNEEVD